MTKGVFTIWDARVAFTGQRRNQRTRNAFESGVHVAVYDATWCYQKSKADYADAEQAGYDWAKSRLSLGEMFECSECKTLHGIAK